jgi:hypothetical protein
VAQQGDVFQGRAQVSQRRRGEPGKNAEQGGQSDAQPQGCSQSRHSRGINLPITWLQNNRFIFPTAFRGRWINDLRASLYSKDNA